MNPITPILRRAGAPSPVARLVPPAAGETPLSFAGHTLDPRRGSLKQGEREIELRPKSFQVLRYLLEHAGRLVPKDELVGIVWPRVAVGDQSLARCVSEIRAALGDRDQQIIKTLSRRGYLFAAAVSRAEAVPAAPAERQQGAAPRLSIVVLPFLNLSGDPAQDYFCDGVTEDLTTALSCLAGAFVIARNSAFSYKGKSVDVRQIGRELGVRYVLEGSVRKAEDRVRVNAQLVDAESGASLWADRFDRRLAELFALQDAIVHELVGVLDIRLIEAESRRSKGSPNPDATDLMIRARAVVNRGITRENYAAGIELLDQSLALDPQNVEAMALLSLLLTDNVGLYWSASPAEDQRRAEALALQAVALDPNDSSCFLALGLARLREGRFDEARSAVETAIRLNRNMHRAHLQLGAIKVLTGRSDEALPHFAEFMRLSPRDPRLSQGLFGIGCAQFLLGDDAQAILALGQAIELSPEVPIYPLIMAASLGMAGREEEAKAAVAAYLRASRMAVITLRVVKALLPSRHPAYLAQCERLFEGLRRAAMREE